MKLLVKKPISFVDGGSERKLDAETYNYLFSGATSYIPSNWDQTHWILTRDDGNEVLIPVTTFEQEILISPDVEVFHD